MDMTPRLIVLVLCLLAPLAATAADPEADSLFAQGTRYYEQGAYQKALTAYMDILDRGVAGGALYYNMGLAYYWLDELGQAIRYFEKARAHLPESERLAESLALARQQTVDQFAALPPPLWQQAWRAVLRAAGIGGLLAAGLLFYFLALLLLARTMLTRERPPWQRWAQRLAFALALLFIVAAFAGSVERAQPSRAVVIAAESFMRAHPQPTAERAETIHEGTVVEVLEMRSDRPWTHVRLPNGTSGWIRTNTVASI